MLNWRFTRCTQIFSFLQSHGKKCRLQTHGQTQKPIFRACWLDWCNWYKSNAILHNSVVCKSLCTVTRSGKRRRRSRIWQIQWSRWYEVIWYCLSWSTTDGAKRREREREEVAYIRKTFFFTISFIQSIYNAYLFFCIKAFDFSNCCLPWTDRRQLFLPELKQLTSELTFNFQYNIRFAGSSAIERWNEKQNHSTTVYSYIRHCAMRTELFYWQQSIHFGADRFTMPLHHYITATIQIACLAKCLLWFQQQMGWANKFTSISCLLENFYWFFHVVEVAG